MTRREIVKKLASAIRTKRPEVEKILSTYGIPVLKTDTNTQVSSKLYSLIKQGNKNAINDIAYLIYVHENFAGFGEIAGLIGSIIGSDTTEQQGQDAITLELIKSGQKQDNTMIIAVIVIVVVFLFIGFILWLKFRK